MRWIDRVKKVHQIIFLGRASDEEVELGRNTVLAVDYEAHGHVDSLRTASVLIASKRFAATT